MTRTDAPLEPHEAELRDLLERTMSDTTTPVEIGPHALRHGHRLRTRRRVSLAAVAVAASAAAALMLPAALGGGSTIVVDPAGEPSSSATAPAQEPLPAERPDGWWNMPATDMVTAVEAILPDGVLVASSGPLTAETDTGPAMGYIAPRLSGPAGPGQLHLVLSPTLDLAADSSTAETDPIDPAPTLPGGNDIHCAKNLSSRVQCSELTAADGTLIGRRTSITSGHVTTLEVVLRRDGGTIYAAATNRLDPEEGPQSSGVPAEQPPLTLDQLEDLVRNDTWVMPAT